MNKSLQIEIRRYAKILSKKYTLLELVKKLEQKSIVPKGNLKNTPKEKLLINSLLIADENKAISFLKDASTGQPPPPPSNELFPLQIFSNSRGYIEQIAKEAASCYDFQLYNGALVLIRRLLETLIIECFEKFNFSGNIKDKNGNYFYLSDLIDAFLKCSSWNLSRNVKNGLPSLKKYGDLAAHNRRFIAKQSDIDSIKSDLRVTAEEILHILDFHN